MRVNILTQPLFTNYGGVLQNFALQQVLKKLGHEPLTVNTPTPPPGPNVLWKDIIKTGINLGKRLKGNYSYPFLSPYKRAVKEYEFSKEFGKFAESHINKENVNPPFTPELIEKLPAEAWIVGSDQVWRPWCSHYIGNCFFDFIPADSSVKRIAYAASFGVDKWEIDDDTTARLKPLAKLFDAISVREKSGVDLARNFLDVKATHVLDPTMLLSQEDYMGVITSPDSLGSSRLVAYILDPSHAKQKEIKLTEKELGLPELRIGVMLKNGLDSIESWLQAFSSAEAVITDSFHGTVFSIIFQKPVKILRNDVRGNTRLDSLLSLLNLKVDKNGFYCPDIETAQYLHELKTDSLNWLSSALK